MRLVDPARAPQLTDGTTVRFAARARAVAGLRAAGVPLRRDGSAEQRYDLLRGEWDTASSTLLRHDGDDEHHRVGDAR